MMTNIIMGVTMHILVERLRKLKHGTRSLVHRGKCGTWLVVSLIWRGTWYNCRLCPCLLILTCKILCEHTTRSLMRPECVHPVARSSLYVLLRSYLCNAKHGFVTPSGCLQSYSAIQVLILSVTYHICLMISFATIDSRRCPRLLEYFGPALRTAKTRGCRHIYLWGRLHRLGLLRFWSFIGEWSVAIFCFHF